LVTEVVVRSRTESKQHERIELLALSHQLSTEVYVVVERVGGAERSFLRDQLDRKSTVVGQLVKQGLACESAVERRMVFTKARRVVLDCVAVLDELGQTFEPALVVGARRTAQVLVDALAPLTVPPPLTR
jgi:hypothetical protein